MICKMFHEAVKRKKLKDNAELVNLQMAINALVEQANALDASHEQLKQKKLQQAETLKSYATQLGGPGSADDCDIFVYKKMDDELLKKYQEEILKIFSM